MVGLSLTTGCIEPNPEWDGIAPSENQPSDDDESTESEPDDDDDGGDDGGDG